MGQMTVEQLYKHLARELVKNPKLAKKKIVVGDDNEGNGFHGMFYGLTTISDDDKSYYADLISDSETNDLDELVILG